MAKIDEMIAEVEKTNPVLANEFRKYVKSHSYGLVFERNRPDNVRLWTKIPQKKDRVNILPPRGQFDTNENFKDWYVSDIVDGIATLSDNEDIVDSKETKCVSVDDIVPVVNYTDEIYPGLKVIEKIERGDKNAPYHMLINAENYHALQMLKYAYAGKVDCIYIDPPYNNGATSWKYNNKIVGENDNYRHSKWLTMMERRLQLAKDLLNPECSVMIVTIDEKEYLRLGMLLEQIFPVSDGKKEDNFRTRCQIQMISTLINPRGATRLNEFSRTDEYLFIVQIGNSSPCKLPLSDEWKFGKGLTNSAKGKLVWQSLRRGGLGNDALRKYHPDCFYPIYVSNDGSKIVSIGDAVDRNIDKSVFKNVDGCIMVLPMRSDGEDGRWQLSKKTLTKALEKGYVKLGNLNDGNITISYLKNGEQKKIENGIFPIIGRRTDGSIIVDDTNVVPVLIPGTQWRISSHDAGSFGTNILSEIFNDKRFTFPKSLYAVEDCLRFFVADKPNALIVDFFAGSGTTAHATMLLNHLDGGHRRCISVTNNEIGPDNEKAFTKQGLRPTDKEWQSKGIANYITWPRIKAAITGIATNGESIKGDYKFTEEFPMSEGFKENAIFCELTYENLWDIRLDRKFNAIAPILWAMAGSKGEIITKLRKGYATTDNYAVLFNYADINNLVSALRKKPNIQYVFVVTDDQQRYLDIIAKLPMIDKRNIYRLYESYLRSFEIRGEGGLD